MEWYVLETKSDQYKMISLASDIHEGGLRENGATDSTARINI